MGWFDNLLESVKRRRRRRRRDNRDDHSSPPAPPTPDPAQEQVDLWEEICSDIWNADPLTLPEATLDDVEMVQLGSFDDQAVLCFAQIESLTVDVIGVWYKNSTPEQAFLDLQIMNQPKPVRFELPANQETAVEVPQVRRPKWDMVTSAAMGWPSEGESKGGGPKK